jgi:hypothetical protein
MSPADFLAIAHQMTVICGGCSSPAKPDKVLGVIVRPQWDTAAPYAIVVFRCNTFDCGEAIPVELVTARAPRSETPAHE